jgi:alkanesulfonate monooxygenase SsuD/methylene tetrahydromethanopterin reductase-like flavin-dependent oxidoreductase (luciferase family)
MEIDLQCGSSDLGWWREAGAAGDASSLGVLWVFDHLAADSLGGEPPLDAAVLLGALATLTNRIGLGSMVMNAANRSMPTTITVAASLQEISGGRFWFGLGAGAGPGTRFGLEHERLGGTLPAEPSERHRRVEHIVDLVDRVWSPHRSAELTGYLLPSPRPPLLLGVNSDPLAELAGRRADGINVGLTNPRLAPLIDGARAAVPAGRQRPWITTVWARFDPALTDPEHPDRQRLDELAVDRLCLVSVAPVDLAIIGDL